MKPVLTSAAMRSADQFTIDEIGVPAFALMESAGRAAAASILDHLRASARPHHAVGVLCGKGNNGGDGLVVARELAEAGCRVRVFMAAGREGLTEEAARNLGIVERLASASLLLAGDVETMADSDVLIDALLGTGQKSAPREPMASLIERVNGWPAFRVALDIPTGLDADTGRSWGSTFRADLTVAIAALKIGHLVHDGPAYSGKTTTVSIGIPGAALARQAASDGCGFLSDDQFVRDRYPTRRRRAHKYDSGPALVIGGSAAYPGAPILAATAAARIGSGYVLAALPAGAPASGPTEIPTIEHGDNEALSAWITRAKAILIGPGLGRSDHARALTRRVAESAACPLVVDADGLRALADEGLLETSNQPRILTPHGGEFSYMTGLDVIPGNPVAVARTWSNKWNAVLILKGAPTVIAEPSGRAVLCGTGGPALATAGTGDVLAGLCTGLLAMGLPPFEAAVAATHLGGAASDAYADHHGRLSMMASDIVRQLPRLLARRFLL